MTGKASIDTRSGRNSISINKSNPRLLRSHMSGNKDVIHVVLHVTKSFSEKEPEFWNVTLIFCQSIPHVDMLHKVGAVATIISCL